MGDLVTLLNSLNLSPINSLLLAALYLVLRSIFNRVEAMETIASKHGKSIAWIKGHLDIEEEE